MSTCIHGRAPSPSHARRGWRRRSWAGPRWLCTALWVSVSAPVMLHCMPCTVCHAALHCMPCAKEDVVFTWVHREEANRVVTWAGMRYVTVLTQQENGDVTRRYLTAPLALCKLSPTHHHHPPPPVPF